MMCVVSFFLWLPTLAFSLKEERSPCDANSCQARSILQVQRETMQSRREMLEDSECTTGVKPIDLVFLVDGSGSVTTNGYQLSQQFVKDVVGDMSFGSGPTSARVAVLQFSDETTVGIGFADGTSKQAVMEAVDGMQYHSEKYSKGTYTNEGIWFAVNKIFAHSRPDAVKLLAVIADGKANGPDPQKAADDARSQGIDLVAIGVGPNIEKDELRGIAGPEGKLLQVSDYKQLSTIVSNTSKIICEEVSTPEPTPAPTPRPTPVPTPRPTPAPTPRPTPVPTLPPYPLASRICIKNKGGYTMKFKLVWNYQASTKWFFNGQTECIYMSQFSIPKFTTVKVFVQVSAGFPFEKNVAIVAYSPSAGGWTAYCDKTTTNWGCSVFH